WNHYHWNDLSPNCSHSPSWDTPESYALHVTSIVNSIARSKPCVRHTLQQLRLQGKCGRTDEKAQRDESAMAGHLGAGGTFPEGYHVRPAKPCPSAGHHLGGRNEAGVCDCGRRSRGQSPQPKEIPEGGGVCRWSDGCYPYGDLPEPHHSCDRSPTRHARNLGQHHV